MWMLDIAREQSPTLGDLRRYLDLTREGGYNAIGLYLEHRFAYPSTPWSHGAGCVTPETIATLESEYSDLQIVPFINLLGHFEGMLYTEYGKRFREETFKGLQACPTCPEFVELCGRLIEDTVQSFKSELIHIGGDETWQLGVCPDCKARMDAVSEVDGKAVIYGEHFGPLARKVQELGRRPAVWGDMFADHPEALAYLPKETMIFDWQYFKSPIESSRKFAKLGFDVVTCPAIQTYNATWCHLSQSEQNVRECVEACRELDAHGVCVTTWECGLFGNYETLFPAIRACGKLLGDPLTPDPSPQKGGEGSLLAAYSEESESHGEWARLMSDDLEAVGWMFAHGTIRSALKCRLLLYSNPFLAWMHHHEELTGEAGDRALAIFARAIHFAPTQAMRGVAEFGKLGIEFVRYAEQARQAYAQGLPGVAVASLTPCRQIFEQLEKIAVATSLNIGGSKADIARCRAARDHVERVMMRIKEYGDGSLGYLPAFEIITHPKFMPHDQASWWLINKWANE
jgi:hypothetical protein